MRSRSRSIFPWLLATGAVAWVVYRRMQQPYYPDVALHAGIELVSRPRRVLAIGPHPDDVEAYAGGTLKLLSQNGSSVTMAVLSRGECATRRANVAEIRSREAEQAAAILGANLIQLDLPDGHLRPGPDLDKALDDLWERVQPDVVLAFDPKGALPFARNKDHADVAAAILNRIRKGIADGERVYFYAARHPNVMVDITEVIEEKTNSLRAHRSQLFGPDWISRFWVRWLSRLHGDRTPAMYSEGFFRLV